MEAIFSKELSLKQKFLKLYEKEREMFEFLDNIREGEKNKHLDNDKEFLIFWKNSPVVSCCKEV